MVVGDLRETGGWTAHELTRAQADVLAASELADVRPLPGSTNVWEVCARDAIGAAMLTAGNVRIDLRVAPKIEVRRLLFLLGYAASPKTWRADWVDLPVVAGLPVAVGEALTRLADRALRAGLLQGYLNVEDAGMTVRGRVRHVEHMRRHFGQPLPVEVTFDEYTVDVAENRILKAALMRMLRVPGMPALTRRRLLIGVHRLAEVTDLVPGAPVPRWTPSRLNARYGPALRMAELVLSGTSCDLARGSLQASGFMLSMSKLFEDFVTVALGEDLVARRGGRVKTQDSRWSLDEAGAVALRPDLVWYPIVAPRSRFGRHAGADADPPGIVVDAKYKAEKRNSFPNADVYQLLAYCTSLGLSRGHLVYAKGNEEGARYRIPGAGPHGSGVTVDAHTLDLDSEPEALLGQIALLAQRIAGTTHRLRVSP